MNKSKRRIPTESELEFLRSRCRLVDNRLYVTREPRGPKKRVFGSFVYGNKTAIVLPTGHHQMQFMINKAKRNFYVHVLVWWLHTGTWPDESFRIDHHDNDPSNNDPKNLRKATGSQNSLNSKLDVRSTTGHKNIQERMNGFEVRIRYKCRTVFNKRFDTLEEAIVGRDVFLRSLRDSAYARTEKGAIYAPTPANTGVSRTPPKPVIPAKRLICMPFHL